MKCVKCGSPTAVSHSNQQGLVQYRKRYCTNLACQYAFGTWEGRESPAAIEKRIRREILAEVEAKLTKGKETTKTRLTPKESWAKRNPEKARLHARNWLTANPERARNSIHRSNMRRQAREEAETTGQPVEEIYARWGVS